MPVRRNVRNMQKGRVFSGTIKMVINDKVDIDMGEGRMLYMIPLIGGPAEIGQTVRVDYTNGNPVAECVGLKLDLATNTVTTVTPPYRDPVADPGTGIIPHANHEHVLSQLQDVPDPTVDNTVLSYDLDTNTFVWAPNGTTPTEGPGIDLVGAQIGIGYDSILLLHSDHSPAGEYANLAAACAAASSGDMILLPPGIFALGTPLTVPASVTIACFSGIAEISGQVILSENSFLFGVVVGYTASSADPVFAVRRSGVGTARMIHCSALATNTGAGNACGAEGGDGGFYIKDTHVSGTANSGTGVGVIVNGGNVSMDGCWIDGVSTSGAGYGVARAGAGLSIVRNSQIIPTTSPFIGMTISGASWEAFATSTGFEVFAVQMENPGGIPMEGDRSAFDADGYPALHANDVDTATGIHHTLGTGAEQAAPGNHTHSGVSHDPITVTDSATVDLTIGGAGGQVLSAAVIPAGIKLDDLGAPDDNNDLNASTVKHGLMPKLGGGTVNFFRADGSWAAPPLPELQAIFTVPGSLAVGAGSMDIYNATSVAKTILKVFLSVRTAPTGASIIVDVNNNGSSIFSAPSRPSIAAGVSTGQSTTFANATWNPGERLAVDIDQIGSGTPGENLTVHIVYQ